MRALQRLWKEIVSKDRRRSDRVPAPRLAVYYWTGSRPVPSEVRDVSPTGLYVLTEERWYPGTIIKMTLQRTNGTDGTVEQHIAVESKVARWGEDGVGLSFVLLDEPDPDVKNTPLAPVQDKRTMEKFLRDFWTDVK